MAILSAVGAVVTGASSLVSGLGNAQDAERKAQNLSWYTAALNGNRVAEAQLRSMAKMCRPQDEDVLRNNPPPGWSPVGCAGHGWATSTAIADAKAKVAELEARRAVAGVATTVAGGAATVAEHARPGSVVEAIIGQVPPLVWVAVAGFAVYWLVKRR